MTGPVFTSATLRIPVHTVLHQSRSGTEPIRQGTIRSFTPLQISRRNRYSYWWKEDLRYDFLAGAKTIRYNVDMALFCMARKGNTWMRYHVARICRSFFADWRFFVFCGNYFLRLGQTGFSWWELIFAISRKYQYPALIMFVFIEYVQWNYIFSNNTTETYPM